MKKPNHSYIFALLLCVLLLSYGAYAKVVLIQGLYYVGDFFMHVQISKSFFQGRGLFFDNVFAPESYIHSYFLLLLLAPLTFAFGAYGLIAAYILFLFLASWRWLAAFQTHNLLLLRSLLVLLAFCFGPISFWILDDYTYGWHSELLFFPLALLFTISLKEHSRFSILWGLLLVLNREDGAVLACSIHLLVASTNYSSLWSTVQSNWLKKLWLFGKPLVGIIAFWLTVFGLGLLVLELFANPAGSRQDKALRFALKLFSDQELGKLILQMLEGTGAMLLSGIMVYLCGLRLRFLSASLLWMVPTFLICLLASFAYLPAILPTLFHGTGWPARFCMLWSLVASGAFLALYSERSSKREKSHSLVALTLAISIGSMYLQYSSLSSYRQYNIRSRILVSESLPNSPLKLALKPKARRILHCMASKVPTDFTLTYTAPIAALFHNHDWVHADNVKNAFKPPEIIICELHGKLAFPKQCQAYFDSLDNNIWYKRKSHGIGIAYRKDREQLNQTVGQCIKQHIGKSAAGR